MSERLSTFMSLLLTKEHEKCLNQYLHMLNQMSFPLVLSLRLVRNPSEERFQTSWNDKNKSGFWTDPRQARTRARMTFSAQILYPATTKSNMCALRVFSCL